MNPLYKGCYGCSNSLDHYNCNCKNPYCYKPCTNLQGESIIKGDFYDSTVYLKILRGESFTDVFPTHNARAVTVFAKNIGKNLFTVSLQNSPNGLDFVEDPQNLELEAGKMGYLVPYIFSKYTRAVVRSTQAASVRLWIQIQNHCYCQHPL